MQSVVFYLTYVFEYWAQYSKDLIITQSPCFLSVSKLDFNINNSGVDFFT